MPGRHQDLLRTRCACGAALTLCSWPRLSSDRYNKNLKRRILVCLDCGHRQIVLPQSRRRGRIFDEDDIKQMVALYEEGKSAREIGEIMHCFRTTVTAYLVEVGVKIRPPGGRFQPLPPPSKFDIETIDWLYWGLGYSIKQVAKAMDISPTTVQSRMERYDIPRRSQGEAQVRSWRFRRQSPGYDEYRQRLREQQKKAWREGRSTLQRTPNHLAKGRRQPSEFKALEGSPQEALPYGSPC